MADPLVSTTQESKLSALNKKIIEIKKKIQLSEGQRKANFEECDAKKRANAEKIVILKKDIKSLHVELAKAKNNEDAADRIAQSSRESSACVRKEGLEAAILRVDEDNIRLRKKLDLVKYQSDKQQSSLAALLKEYEELVKGRSKKLANKKLDHPLKKKIVTLENQLQRVSVMQMEADTVRKKYRCVRSSLKADAATYVSSLRNLENIIKEQENEIKQLQTVKEEAIDLRDTTKETLTRQEIEAMNTSKSRNLVIMDYRQRVEDRKLELERLERIIFPATRQIPREDFEAHDETTIPTTTSSTSAANATTRIDENVDSPKYQLTKLEEIFEKLRIATGVTKNEDVLQRFLSQRSTKEKLQKMRNSSENEKMSLEMTRQQLMAEIESQRFSETKDADQNAEEIENVNREKTEQFQRQCGAESKASEIRLTVKDINRILWKLCDLLRNASALAVPTDPEDVHDPQNLLAILEEKIKSCIELMGGPEKYGELIDPTISDKIENSPMAAKSENGKIVHSEERPLFPLFPGRATPAAPAQVSEDDEDVPTRSVLKRQAQLLVDTKSRRKGFNFRR